MAQPRSRSRSIRRRFVPFLLLALAGALQAPFATAEGDRLLVFTKTGGYRHDSIPAAVAAISGLAARYRIAVEHSEDAALFRLDNLLRFKTVAFVNTTGDILDVEQQRAFEAFIGAGGGYLGVHSAADTEYDWPWYGELVGAWFKSHPPGLQTGTVRFARPLGGSWPVAWRVTDEFYNYRSRPSAEATVISALDESTYEGGEMGAEHPIAWCRKIHGGRAWYTGLGHRPELFGDATFLAHLEKVCSMQPLSLRSVSLRNTSLNSHPRPRRRGRSWASQDQYAPARERPFPR